jgi:predicted DNA-binding transcriptional regulator AlpA
MYHKARRPIDAPDVIADPLLSTNEVAIAINKHPLSIYRMLREKKAGEKHLDFPDPIRISENRLAWRKSAIEAFIASRPGHVSRGLLRKKTKETA